MLDNECFDPKSKNFCISTLMKSLNLDSRDIDKCVNNTFGSETPNYYNDDNKILFDERRKFLESGIFSWPSVVIN